MQHLEGVLQLLSQNHYLINKKKCLFGRKSIEYLGHIISSSRLSMDPTKLQSIKEWLVPKNVRGVWGFLGLTRYYRKFIKNYGQLAKPLIDLTKKDGFYWGVET